MALNNNESDRDDDDDDDDDLLARLSAVNWPSRWLRA